jgi:hypothetical protein
VLTVFVFYIINDIIKETEKYFMKNTILKRSFFALAMMLIFNSFTFFRGDGRAEIENELFNPQDNPGNPATDTNKEVIREKQVNSTDAMFLATSAGLVVGLLSFFTVWKFDKVKELFSKKNKDQKNQDDNKIDYVKYDMSPDQYISPQSQGQQQEDNNLLHDKPRSSGKEIHTEEVNMGGLFANDY